MHSLSLPTLLLLLGSSTAVSAFGARGGESPLVVTADSVRSTADSTARTVKLNSALIVGRRQNKVDNAAMGLNFLRPEQIRSIPDHHG